MLGTVMCTSQSIGRWAATVIFGLSDDSGPKQPALLSYRALDRPRSFQPIRPALALEPRLQAWMRSASRRSSASTQRQARHRLHDITGAPFQPIESAIGRSVGIPVPSMTMASSGLSSSVRSACAAAEPPRL